MLEGILVITIVAVALVAAAFAMGRLSKGETGCGPSCCCGDAADRKDDGSLPKTDGNSPCRRPVPSLGPDKDPTTSRAPK